MSSQRRSHVPFKTMTFKHVQNKDYSTHTTYTMYFYGTTEMTAKYMSCKQVKGSGMTLFCFWMGINVGVAEVLEPPISR